MHPFAICRTTADESNKNRYVYIYKSGYKPGYIRPICDGSGAGEGLTKSARDGKKQSVVVWNRWCGGKGRSSLALHDNAPPIDVGAVGYKVSSSNPSPHN